MSDKRSADTAPAQPRTKRTRFEPLDASQNGSLSGLIKPVAQPAQNGSSAADKLQRAKALLANKDALKAQVQALKERRAQATSGQSTSAVPSFGAAGSAPAREPSYRPSPLLIDDKGREVDASGRLVEKPVLSSKKPEGGNIVEPDKPKGPRPEEFYDPLLTDKSFKRLDRRQRAGFEFVKAGSFQKEAEQRRLKAVFGDEAIRQHRERQETERRAATKGDQVDPNFVPLGQRVFPTKKEIPAEEPIPDVEWWDANILTQPDTYDNIDEGLEALNDKKITIYVEHPVPLEPPAEEALPPPMPLPLTTRERKKLRTQRRLEKEKEKQELIRQGLLEPPKPKLKLSTFYRSMGVEAAADPTAIEQQVRADQEARAQAHEDRNLATKLTPAERREKKVRKLTGAANEGEARPVNIYRVTNLALPQHKFKVRANAEELHMTGCAVVTDKVAVIIVEGGAKAQKKYAHIVLNRIKWNQDKEDEDDQEEDRPQNQCVKMWSGTVKTSAFSKFVIEVCRTEEAARKFLADRSIEHYWDLAMADKD